MKSVTKYFERLDSIYLAKGYLVKEDLKINSYAAGLLLWLTWKFGYMLRMSTVVDGNKVICFHDSSTLVGHAHYPNAHVETRYTQDKKFFRQKVFGE
jgi:hypothetical protein